MAMEDRQQLSEVVDVADIAVRVASQLRLFKAGRPLKDQDALLKAQEFLDAAIIGGTFIQTGQASGLQSTLRPLNWSADVRSDAAATPDGTPPSFDYQGLVTFLTETKEVLTLVSSQEMPVSEQLDSAVEFFSRLGNLLGTRADQRMRFASGVLGGVAVTA